MIYSKKPLSNFGMNIPHILASICHNLNFKQGGLFFEKRLFKKPMVKLQFNWG